MTGYLFDTHTWLWVQQGDAKKLSADLVRDLEQHQRAGELFVSAVSILEIARLVAFGGYDLGMSVEQFWAEGVEENGLQLLDLSPRVLIASTRLPGSPHRDPSDRLLIATAREHGLTLITRDKEILAYAQAGYVKVRKL